MKLHNPFIITARLLPGLKIGDGFVSLEYAGQTDDGRTRFKYTIDLPDGTEHEASDLKSGVGGGDLQSGFESLLSFLDAAVSSYRYNKLQYSNDPDDNCSLFPRKVVEWAYHNESEIQMFHLEIEESKKQLIEE